MNIAQKKKIINRIVELEADIEQLKRVRIELATSGYSSASLSSGGGSKSYTRVDIDKISNLIKELSNELEQYQNMLLTGRAKPIKTIITVYS